MYKAIRSGSCNGYRFTAGGMVHGAPEGSLSGCRSVVWIEDDFKEDTETVIPKPLNGTIPEIKEWLDDHRIEYPSTARKGELVEILKDA